jgi:hypothetical protein
VTTPQVSFGQILQTVAGQAFNAAGYRLQDTPMHHARGMYRYEKPLAHGVTAYVEFQLLYYQGGGLSRFRVNLLRNTGPDARSATNYPDKVDTTLSKLIWDDFGVQQLSGPEHWWLFSNMTALGQAIAEAGKLVIGFGIPWLEGELQPGQE